MRISNILVFRIGEHSDNKKVSISVHYFSPSRCMLIFNLVGKLVLLICIKSALIVSFPTRTIDRTPLNYGNTNLRRLLLRIEHFENEIGP